MKIDNSGKSISTTVTRADNKSAGKATSAGAETASSKTDNVDINPFSARLQSLESSLANQPAIDETKVAEVRQAITEGRFSINPDAIADKLMKSVKDLLTKQK